MPLLQQQQLQLQLKVHRQVCDIPTLLAIQLFIEGPEHRVHYGFSTLEVVGGITCFACQFLFIHLRIAVQLLVGRRFSRPHNCRL